MKLSKYLATSLVQVSKSIVNTPNYGVERTTTIETQYWDNGMSTTNTSHQDRQVVTGYSQHEKTEWHGSVCMLDPKTQKTKFFTQSSMSAWLRGGSVGGTYPIDIHSALYKDSRNSKPSWMYHSHHELYEVLALKADKGSAFRLTIRETPCFHEYSYVYTDLTPQVLQSTNIFSMSVGAFLQSKGYANCIEVIKPKIINEKLAESAREKLDGRVSAQADKKTFNWNMYGIILILYMIGSSQVGFISRVCMALSGIVPSFILPILVFFGGGLLIFKMLSMFTSNENFQLFRYKVLSKAAYDKKVLQSIKDEVNLQLHNMSVRLKGHDYTFSTLLAFSGHDRKMIDLPFVENYLNSVTVLKDSEIRELLGLFESKVRSDSQFEFE